MNIQTIDKKVHKKENAPPFYGRAKSIILNCTLAAHQFLWVGTNIYRTSMGVAWHLRGIQSFRLRSTSLAYLSIR